MLTELAAGKPDVIVFELGDGILGDLRRRCHPRMRGYPPALTAVLLSANDPVAAWGGVKLLRERFGIEPCAVTGPGDRQSGRRRDHHEQMQVPAFNALSERRGARRLR